MNRFGPWILVLALLTGCVYNHFTVQIPDAFPEESVRLKNPKLPSHDPKDVKILFLVPPLYPDSLGQEYISYLQNTLVENNYVSYLVPKSYIEEKYLPDVQLVIDAIQRKEESNPDPTARMFMGIFTVLTLGVIPYYESHDVHFTVYYHKPKEGNEIKKYTFSKWESDWVGILPFFYGWIVGEREGLKTVSGKSEADQWELYLLRCFVVEALRK